MDKKFVITIGRQLGSGGKAVAEMLGQRLGVPVYDKQIIFLILYATNPITRTPLSECNLTHITSWKRCLHHIGD